MKTLHGKRVVQGWLLHAGDTAYAAVRSKTPCNIVSVPSQKRELDDPEVASAIAGGLAGVRRTAAAGAPNCA